MILLMMVCFKNREINRWVIYKLIQRRRVIHLVHDVTAHFIAPFESEFCYKHQKLKFMCYQTAPSNFINQPNAS